MMIWGMISLHGVACLKNYWSRLMNHRSKLSGYRPSLKDSKLRPKVADFDGNWMGKGVIL